MRKCDIQEILRQKDGKKGMFNWKDGSKTVTLAELEAAEEAAVLSVESAKVINIADFRCSHLDDNRPPHATIKP